MNNGKQRRFDDYTPIFSVSRTEPLGIVSPVTISKTLCIPSIGPSA
jgi:hypothetical protein